MLHNNSCTVGNEKGVTETVVKTMTAQTINLWSDDGCTHWRCIYWEGRVKMVRKKTSCCVTPSLIEECGSTSHKERKFLKLLFEENRRRKTRILWVNHTSRMDSTLKMEHCRVDGWKYLECLGCLLKGWYGAIVHFILNIADMKERYVYIINTLNGIKPNENNGGAFTLATRNCRSTKRSEIRKSASSMQTAAS